MKICFVGSGSIGKRHIRNLWSICREIREPLEIHLLRSSHSELNKDLQSIVDRQLFSMDELQPLYDAIFICNPTYLHYDSVKALSKFAKSFFVEKPIFDSGNYEINQLSLPMENQYYVACPLRYTGVLQYAKEIVHRESVICARAISSSYLPDWRQGTDYRECYSAHKDKGGGVRADLIHEWDYLVDLFGYPEKVCSFSGKLSELEIDSEDMAVYIGKYSDKLVEVHLDYVGRYPQRCLEIWTNENKYLFDILNKCIYTNGKMSKSFDEKANDMYLEEMKYFLKLMRGTVNSSNDLKKALSVLRIAEGIEWKKENCV